VNTLTHFQQSLDAELRERAEALPAAAPPARRARPPRRLLLAAGTAAAAVAVAVAVPLSTGGGADPAYAVIQRTDGTVAIRLFSPSGSSGLQAELRRLHIRAVALEATAGCNDKELGSTSALESVIVHDHNAGGFTVIRPSAIPRDQTLLISVYEIQATPPNGSGVAAAIRLQTVKHVPSCVNVLDVGVAVSRRGGPATVPHLPSQPAAVGSPSSR
jgi:hypothetical protein